MIKNRRVVVVGSGVISPLGHSPEELWESLAGGKSSVVKYEPWQDPSLGLSSSFASPVTNFDEMRIPRKWRRSMSRIAMLSHVATEQAVEKSGFTSEMLASSRTGVFYGSCMGGLRAIDDYFQKVRENNGNLVKSANATTFLRIMPHTCAANIAVSFGVGGRVNASSTACAAGTQAIGFGYEAIKYGLLDRALCGGAEELSPSVAAIFDALGATQGGKNPAKAPKPFDPLRSGIVVGEGAGTLALESLEGAIDRGAQIFAEIGGFFTSGDGFHMTDPAPEGLMISMEGALKDWGADKKPGDIDYINAHAAGTQSGDRAESIAIERVFGAKVPISSTKGNFGHLMGGTGVIETIASLGMMDHNLVLPTKNHDDIDAACGKIDYVRQKNRNITVNAFMKNSFAFGGVNACLIVTKV